VKAEKRPAMRPALRLGHARNALTLAAKDAESATAKAHEAAELARKAFALAGRAERLACEALAEVEALLNAYPATSRGSPAGGAGGYGTPSAGSTPADSITPAPAPNVYADSCEYTRKP